MSRTRVILLALGIGGLLALATIIVWPQSVARAVSSVLDPLWWDVIQGGEITWGKRALVVPRGKYKWVVTDNDVVIVDRSSGRFVLTLVSENVPGIDAIDRERRVCASAAARCEKLQESPRFGSVDAKAIEYTDTAENRLVAVIQPAAVPVSVQLSADSQASLQEGKALASTLLEQLAGKTRSAN